MHPASMSKSNSARRGPLTTVIAVTLDVVAASADQLNAGARMASSTATTDPNASGATPAIAALTATFSTVHGTTAGARSPSTWSAASGVAATSSATAASVGA